MNTRRRLVFALGAGALMPPLARAQADLPRIVIFSYAARIDQRQQAFREGMRDLGYIEGRNVIIELRSAQLSREVADRLVDEILATRPAAVISQGYTIYASAARTKTIPIVAASSGDMIDAKLVKSLASPGGNVTGVQLMALELVGKRVELLKELVPGLRRIAAIADPQHAGEHRERDASLQAAERLGIRVSYHPVRNAGEFDAGLVAARAAGAEALLFFPDAVTNNRAAEAAAFALQHRLPTVAGWDNYAEDGHLLTYGPNLRASWRRLAYFVDRILKGASPANLPVELPTVFELVVNLKTARAIGVRVPRSILARADRIIE